MCVHRVVFRYFRKRKPGNEVSSLWESSFRILVRETEKNWKVRRMRRFGEGDVSGMRNMTMT